MPLGLASAPATFQSALNMVLALDKWKTCLVYVDDILFFSKTMENHICHVDEILTALQEAKISQRMKNCKFFSD